MGKNSKKLAELNDARVQTLEETTDLLTIDDFEGNQEEFTKYLQNVYSDLRQMEYRYVCRNESMKLYNLEKYGREYGLHENNSIWIGYTNLLKKFKKGTKKYDIVKSMIDNSAACRAPVITKKSTGAAFNGGFSCAIGANSTLAAISGTMGYDGSDNICNVTSTRNFKTGRNDALCANAVGNTPGVPEEHCHTQSEVRKKYGRITVAYAIKNGILGVGSIYARPSKGGSTGHARVIAGIIRNEKGEITHVTIAETNSCKMITYPISVLEKEIFQNGADTEDVMMDNINEECMALADKSPEEIIAEINKTKERIEGVINELHETETFCNDQGNLTGMSKYIGLEIEQEKREGSKYSEYKTYKRDETAQRKETEEIRKKNKEYWDNFYKELQNKTPQVKVRELSVEDIQFCRHVSYTEERERLEELVYLPDDENIFKKARRFIFGKRTNPILSSGLSEFAKAKIENLKYIEEQAKLRESLQGLNIFDKNDSEQNGENIRTSLSVKEERERLEKFKKENKDNLSKEEAKAMDKYIKSLKNEENFRKKMEEKGLNDKLHKSLADFARETEQSDGSEKAETPEVVEQSDGSEKAETPEVVEQSDGSEKEKTKTDMKVQVDKNEIKTESAKAHIELKNGRFTARIRKEIIEKLTPIYGEYAEEIYIKAINYPKYFDEALGIKRSKLNSKALLEDLLSFEGENVEKVIAYVKANPNKDLQKRAKKGHLKKQQHHQR